MSHEETLAVVDPFRVVRVYSQERLVNDRVEPDQHVVVDGDFEDAPDDGPISPMLR